MTYTLEKMPGRPIIIATIHEDYVPQRDIAQSNADGIALLNTCETPIHYIIDIRALKNVPLEDLLMAVNCSSKAPDSLYRHPLLDEIIFVTTDILVQAAAPGLGEAIFGGVQACTFPTIDEAISYINVKK